MAHDSSLQEYHDSESKNLVSNPSTRVRDLQLPGTSHKLMNLIQSDKKSELIMAEGGGGGGGGRERGVLQLSPKSVITDIRSLVSKSPDSFSSSSSSRREYCDGVSSITGPAAGAAALIVDGGTSTSTSRRRTGRSKWLLPSRHDRGYSISDVEDQIMSDSSDQSSSLFDSSNASSSSEEILATAKVTYLNILGPRIHCDRMYSRERVLNGAQLSWVLALRLCFLDWI
jgi:hypothetical protein